MNSNEIINPRDSTLIGENIALGEIFVRFIKQNVYLIIVYFRMQAIIDPHRCLLVFGLLDPALLFQSLRTQVDRLTLGTSSLIAFYLFEANY